MGLLARLRKQLRTARGELQAIIDKCDAESRDMSDDESAKVDSLASKVEELEARIEALEKAGDPDADDDGEPVRSARGFDRTSPPPRRPGRRSRPMGDGPAVHTRRERPYSLLRAIQGAYRGRLDGLEQEVSVECERRATRTGRMLAGQFHMPMGLDPELRELMHPGSTERDRRRAERRDLTTTTGAGSIFTVPEEPFIELLRSRLVLAKLGITVLDDLQGLIAMPRQNAAATVNWVGEGTSATPSNPTTDDVPFGPHTAIALTNISYMFALQTSWSAERMVKNDLAKQMAIEADKVGLNGAGGAQPTGLANISAVVSRSAAYQKGTNGGNPTYADAVAMEGAVSTANADFGRLAYLSTPSVRSYLKQQPQLANTINLPVWQTPPGAEPGKGEMNGYSAWASTILPSNLTKGTGTGLSQLFFGNWEDLIQGVWDDALSFLINPFTNQASGGIIISTTMAIDYNVRHAESFIVIGDAKGS